MCCGFARVSEPRYDPACHMTLRMQTGRPESARHMIQGLYPPHLPLRWRWDETEMILFDLMRSLVGEARLSKIPHSRNALPVSRDVCSRTLAETLSAVLPRPLTSNSPVCHVSCRAAGLRFDNIFSCGGVDHSQVLCKIPFILYPQQLLYPQLYNHS